MYSLEIKVLKQPVKNQVDNTTLNSPIIRLYNFCNCLWSDWQYRGELDTTYTFGNYFFISIILVERYFSR